MNFLESIPLPPGAMSYVIGLLPILALAIGIVITALAERGNTP